MRLHTFVAFLLIVAFVSTLTGYALGQYWFGL